MNCIYDKLNYNSSKLIDSYFVLESNGGNNKKTDLILPDCTPGIMYIEQGCFSRKSVDAHSSRYKEGKLYLFGQKSKAVEYIYDSPDLRAFGCKLRPFAIYSLFGISADEITEKVIELDNSLVDLDLLIPLLRSQSEEDFLPIKKEIPVALIKVLKDIHLTKGMMSIILILKKYNISYKKLQRMFKLHVGLTPKLYSRIIRFNHSLRMGVDKKHNLTDVAYQSGFFDQNHYIKEAKYFSGLVPTEIFNFESNDLEINHISYLLQRTY